MGSSPSKEELGNLLAPYTERRHAGLGSVYQGSFSASTRRGAIVDFQDCGVAKHRKSAIRRILHTGSDPRGDHEGTQALTPRATPEGVGAW